MYSLLLAVIYLAFIGLGLPDSLLGAAWPSMYTQLAVPVSFAGIISMIIAVGTIISSLNSDRLTKKFGAGKITAVSVAMTAAAMIGFCFSRNFLLLCLLAVPYGLGAGSVDAALNNYVALHYASRHMSWLHCMWGVGTIAGPYITGYGLSHGKGWGFGYGCVGALQIILCIVLFISLPLWKKIGKTKSGDISAVDSTPPEKALSLKEIFKIKGIKELTLTFFCYCAVEQTTILWASSYMVLHSRISAKTAASYAALFFIGITVGRALNGFLTIKFSDRQMIITGQIIITAGAVIMLLPLNHVLTLIGLILIGLGCAPVYPCIIHSIPQTFGRTRSQAIIGVQMASAYIGTCLMPPLFGLIANHISVALLPVYLLIITALMMIMFIKLTKTVSPSNQA